MGGLIGRFRKKPSTIEVLEQIEKDISSIQRFRLKNQQQQKKLIASLILYSSLLYIVSALLFYFYYFPSDWKNRVLYSIPLLIFPFLIWLIKKVLHWYFVKRIAKNDIALNELRAKRTQILEEVMEKETYKKAREILQKFDPAKFKELETPSKPISKPTEGSTLRQRPKASPSAKLPSPTGPAVLAQGQRFGTPRPALPTNRVMTPMGPRPMMVTPLNGRAPSPPLPRPIPPRERGTMDRLLEYLVGDGPQNKYALICRYCHSHNGMALKEEFEYISFRCCYCYQLNQARKQRPFAPKLDTVTPSKPNEEQIGPVPRDKTHFPRPPVFKRDGATANQGNAKESEEDDSDEDNTENDEEEEEVGDESDFEKIPDDEDEIITKEDEGARVENAIKETSQNVDRKMPIAVSYPKPDPIVPDASSESGNSKPT